MVLTKQLLIDAGLLLLAVMNVVFLWDNHTLATIVAIAIVAAAFIFFHTRDDIIFYVTGAVLGTVAEMVCVHFGAWSYTTTVIIIPFWASILWGFVFIFVRRLKQALVQKNPARRELVFPWTELYSVFLFIVLVGFVSAFWQHNLLLFSIICVLLAANLYWFHGTEDTFYALAALILGPALESIAIASGAWQYTQPDFFNIPLWLIPAYGLFSLLVERIANDLSRKLHG